MPNGIVWSPITIPHDEHSAIYGFDEAKCRRESSPMWFDLMAMNGDRFYYDYDASNSTEYIKSSEDGSVYASRVMSMSESNGIYTIDLTITCEDLGIDWVYRWMNDADGNWTGGRYR
jgi:hypothetical protein